MSKRMKTTIKTSSDLLRISQAADLLNVDATTVLRWIGKGYLKSTRYPSGSHRIEKSEVERFLRNSRNRARMPKNKIYRIMIIDEEEFLGNVLQEVLETSGLPLTIRTNRDPLSALVEVGIFNPDLIIVDYKLGEFDGLELVAKVSNNKEFNGIPVIMISGHRDAIANQPDTRISAFLKKPFKSAELKNTVMKCLQLEQ
jgi:excisionase family DNA binding protein